MLKREKNNTKTDELIKSGNGRKIDEFSKKGERNHDGKMVTAFCNSHINMAAAFIELSFGTGKRERNNTKIVFRLFLATRYTPADGS